jgi:hypothetical protein
LLQLILHHLLCGRHACHFCIGLCILLSSMQLLIFVQWKRNIDTISLSIIVTEKRRALWTSKCSKTWKYRTSTNWRICRP